MIDKTITYQTESLEPHVDIDGTFVCQICYEKLKITNHKCPKCNQLINWSWADDGK